MHKNLAAINGQQAPRSPRKYAAAVLATLLLTAATGAATAATAQPSRGLVTADLGWDASTSTGSGTGR
jgi:hypothetical protein